MRLSIIIPTLNEAATVQYSLRALQDIRQRGHEIILVDGGSNDATLELARPLVDHVIETSRGRAQQMNAGSQQAQGDVLWFLHSDTLVPKNADRLIEKKLSDKKRHWGRFNVRLSGENPLYRIIELMMNLRSCVTGIATGDQGIFVRRDSFESLGGYRLIALMEDVELSRRLKKHFGRPACVDAKLITSHRRWEQLGIFKTVVLMWYLRLAYYFGADPDKLKQHYNDNA